eukprot:TRINITY_DN55931_c0_g1_i1.p1 TRINITY_DN55931_c0_g1~~TRINITY_DN55931_c0_g1_i1.p1  ORF type:complete len:179 (-),score=31.52 TRINITY_DN55931_c0_g1_i1:154-690(-)
MCSSFLQEMNIRNIFLTLLIFHKKVSSYMMSSRKLLCFSQPKGDATKDCDKTRGFKTCFTRYDSEGLVTGRGCSTKRSSYKKCETHSYGKISQKFCYCKKTMCNPSTMVLPTSILTLSTSILLTPALLSIASSFSTISILTMISLFSTVSGVIQRIPGLFGVIMRYRRKRRRRPDPEL